MATISLQTYLETLISKYERYISNMEWHIKTNKPTGKELEAIETRIIDFRGVINDLKIN